jgi:hypothetical protein
VLLLFAGLKPCLIGMDPSVHRSGVPDLALHAAAI